MKTQTLNVDVLAMVCEFLTDFPDILSFGLTCSSLRPVSVKCLLSIHPIRLILSHETYILKFRSFLFADAYRAPRALHIRALTLGLDFDSSQNPYTIAYQQDTSSTLIEILTSCSRLEHVTLSMGDRYSANQDSRLIDAIAAIPSLRSLSVHCSTEASEEASIVLRKIRAPLRTVGIYCHNAPDGYWHPTALQKTLKLPRLAATLTTIELGIFGVNMPGNVPLSSIQTPSIPTMAQYPAVRSLIIRTLIQQPRLDCLQHLFPALDGTLSIGQINGGLPQDSYAHTREMNQRAQQQSGRPSRAWKKLDRVVVRDGLMLYILGLLCPIRLVILDNAFEAHIPGSFFHDKEALRENPVPRLKLSLALAPKHRVTFDEFLSPELAGTLTHLTVCFLYSNGNAQRTLQAAEIFALFRWDTLLGEIVTALQPLHKLTHLRIVVHATVWHDGPWTAAHSEGFIQPIRGSAFDFEGAAAALVRPLPSLQFVALTTDGRLGRWRPEHRWKAYEQWNATRAFRVARPSASRPGPDAAQVPVQDGEPVLVGLHDEVAETIMRTEELELSEADKAFMTTPLVRQYL